MCVVFRALLGAMMKRPSHCTSMGEKLDSSVAQAAGATLERHWWDARKDGGNTLAPVVTAGDVRWLSGSSSTLWQVLFLVLLDVPTPPHKAEVE